MSLSVCDAGERGVLMAQKKRCRFLIDEETANRLEAMRSRTGLSIAEQIRRALGFWLERDDNRGSSERVSLSVRKAEAALQRSRSDS